MKILICSDIHANYEALKVVYPYLKIVDKAFCVGDIVGYGCAVNECIDFLRENSFICIQGNHDRYLIEGTERQSKFLNESVIFGIEIAKSLITEDNRNWIEQLPISLGVNIDNRRILFVHGSPFDPINEYVYENTINIEKFRSLNYDIIVCGHTHRELYIDDRPIILNPGAIGQARDYEGKVCFTILETKTLMFQRFRLSYDFDSHLRMSENYGGKEWLYKHFKNVTTKDTVI